MTNKLREFVQLYSNGYIFITRIGKYTFYQWEKKSPAERVQVVSLTSSDLESLKKSVDLKIMSEEAPP